MKARKKVNLPRRKSFLDVLDEDGKTIYTVYAESEKEAHVIRRVLYRIMKYRLHKKINFKTRAS